MYKLAILGVNVTNFVHIGLLNKHFFSSSENEGVEMRLIVANLRREN